MVAFQVKIFILSDVGKAYIKENNHVEQWIKTGRKVFEAK